MDTMDDQPARVDVLTYTTPDGDSRHRFVDAGYGSQVVGAHVVEYRKRTLLRYLVALFAPPFGYAFLLFQLPVPLPAVAYPVVVSSVALGLLTTGVLLFGGVLPPLTPADDSPLVPRLSEENLPRERAARLFPDHE